MNETIQKLPQESYNDLAKPKSTNIGIPMHSEYMLKTAEMTIA
jgi:hypothetical protein